MVDAELFFRPREPRPTNPSNTLPRFSSLVDRVRVEGGGETEEGVEGAVEGRGE
mgnify:CR=1 FL=1